MRRVAWLLCCVVFNAWGQGMVFEAGTVCEADRCQGALFARGDIETGSAGYFREAVHDLRPGAVVVLDSRGGNLTGGLLLGQSIRRAGFHTQVQGECLSACVYAFLGGVERQVKEGARVGVHQFRSTKNTLDGGDAQRMGAALGRYLDLMGADRKLLDLANLTPPDKTTLLSREQLKSLRVDNSEMPSPRWRLEATDEGLLFAVVHHALGSRAAISFLLMRTTEGLRLRVWLRGGLPATALGAPMSLTLEVGETRFELTSLGPWRAAREGQLISFALPDQVHAALAELPNKSSFTLDAAWPRALNAQPLGRVRLSAEGLRGVLLALKQANPERAAAEGSLP